MQRSLVSLLALVEFCMLFKPLMFTGLERDLGMAGYDFNIALTVFYVFVRTPNFSNSRALTFQRYIVRCLGSTLQSTPQTLWDSHLSDHGNWLRSLHSGVGIRDFVRWPYRHQSIFGNI